MIDSHCHLADEVFAPDLEAVVERARHAGLERVLVILEAGVAGEAAQARLLEALWPEVRVAVGVHPHRAHEYADDPARAARVVRTQIASTPSARAIGEIGLDYHYDYSPPAVQRIVFRVQVQLARELGRPIVVHTREADEDTMAILTEEGGGDLRGVLHCFTGDTALALAALGLGFYISAAGIVTFPKSTELRSTLGHVPLDRLLVETDSPFLSPVPHRGRRNEPAHVSRVVETVAGLRGIPAPEMARQTTENFHTLFRP
jgi:TatD DNase family protein